MTTDSPWPPPTGSEIGAWRHGCEAAWPDCRIFGYDPRCCRFPKSCSAPPVLVPLTIRELDTGRVLARDHGRKGGPWKVLSEP